MKISKECIDEALRDLKDFSKEELDEYVRDVFEKAKAYKGMSNRRAFEEAMKEVNDDRLKSYFESVQTAANNVQKINYLADRIKNGKATLQNISVKMGNKNQSNNIAAAQHSSHEELDGEFFSRVTREETSFFSSGDNDQLIADAYDGKKVDSAEANRIAQILKENYFPRRNADMITSNAIPFEHINQDRHFRNIHDSNKLILGGRSAINEAKSKKKMDLEVSKRKWIDTVKKHFDLIHSDAIDAEGNVDVVKLDKIIGDMYDNITTGKSDLFTRSIVVNDRVAVQNRSRRRLQPKSMRDFLEYNKEYGQGNLFKAMLMDMQTSSSKIGMARMLGDSPHAAYLDLLKIQREAKPDYKWFKQAERNFTEVLGSNKTAENPTLAAYDANTRALTSMARLPTVALRSLPDINQQAIFAMNHGVNYFEAWGHHLKHIFDLYPSEDRKFLAKAYASMFRQHLGYLGKVSDANNLNERLNKISTAFFKINMLHSFDQGNKMSGIELMSRGLGRHSKNKFDNLPLATRNFVAKFLEPEEWELLRSKNTRGLFTVENVSKLTEKEIKEFYESGNKLRPHHEIRNDLYRKVHAMAQIAAENMVLSPGEFEKALLLRNTRPGSPEGVILRQLLHFKGFALKYIDNVLIRGYKDADAAQQKLAWATAQLIGALPLAYGVSVLENFAAGKSMPDITKMNPAQATKFLLELSQPGLALFAGLLDPKHQNADGVLSLLFSPSLRLIGNSVALPFATATGLAEGDTKKVMKSWMNVAKYMLPIYTFPGISPMIKEIMGEKAHLEPGQEQYYGA